MRFDAFWKPHTLLSNPVIVFARGVCQVSHKLGCISQVNGDVAPALQRRPNVVRQNSTPSLLDLLLDLLHGAGDLLQALHAHVRVASLADGESSSIDGFAVILLGHVALPIFPSLPKARSLVGKRARVMRRARHRDVRERRKKMVNEWSNSQSLPCQRTRTTVHTRSAAHAGTATERPQNGHSATHLSATHSPSSEAGPPTRYPLP